MRGLKRWMAMGVAAALLLGVAGTIEARPKSGKGLGLGHYKSYWKNADGSANVEAKAALRQRLRAGEVISTDAELGSTIITPRTSRRIWRTDHTTFHSDLDARLAAGEITRAEWDRMHRRWHRRLR